MQIQIHQTGILKREILQYQQITRTITRTVTRKIPRKRAILPPVTII
jgi:hypothetical protein